jgi:hypothetical protein
MADRVLFFQPQQVTNYNFNGFMNIFLIHFGSKIMMVNNTMMMIPTVTNKYFLSHGIIAIG